MNYTQQYPWNGGLNNQTQFSDTSNQRTNLGYQQVPYGYPQQAQTPTPSYLFGKIVNDPDKIAPNEVPMNGSPGFFPMPDYSAIYVKAWQSNGSIGTIKFIPEVQNEENTTQENSMLTEVLERLERIENTLASNSSKKLSGKKSDDNA